MKLSVLYSDAINDLAARVGNVETEREQISRSFDALKMDLRKFNNRIHGYERDHNSLLHSVLTTAHSYVPRRISQRSILAESTASVWTPAISFLLIQGAIMLLIWTFRFLVRDKAGRKRTIGIGGRRQKSF